jgi:putative ABC transport system permease protein
VLSFNVALPEARYGSDAQVRRFYEQALARVGDIAGVQSAGLINALPLRGGMGPNGYFEVEGKTLWQPNDAPLAEWRLVDGDYHRSMGIPLIRGRFFTPQDDERTRPVIIVNQALAQRCWPGEDPIGKRLNVGGPQLSEVVGVVGDVRTYDPGRAAPFEIDAPHRQYPQRSMSFVVRTAAGDPLALVTPLRTEMAAIDPSQPLSDVRTMEQVVQTRLAQPTLLMVLTSAFAGLAAVLALIGVYGLMAYTISQQRGEFGIRLAIGATPGELLRLVLARGAILAAIGIALGGLGAIGLTRFMTSLLYQVTPTDPVVIVAACAAILVAALAACLVPALTAARVDPIEELRVS